MFGAVDDLWVNLRGIIGGLRPPPKDQDVSIDSDWQISYKRQMEVYQWLLRQSDLDVSATGCFVYTNGRMDLDSGDRLGNSRTKIIPVQRF